MKKLKKIIMPLMLGAFLFGGNVLPEATFFEPVEVHASKDNVVNDATGLPTITFDGDGNLQLGEMAEGEKEGLFNKILEEYRGIVIFISGVGTISMILFFIMNFINLGKSQGNPQERQKAITGLIISGVASAGLGSVTLITTLFFNVFRVGK